ncbi:hypothetical protein V6N13_052813 [Hibiscus sabdariffa]
MQQFQQCSRGCIMETWFAISAKSSLGMMSCLETTWQKFPPHLWRRIDRWRASLPSIGEPNVMHSTGIEEDTVDCRWQSSQRAERVAAVPPMEWPVNTIDLTLLTNSGICTPISN